jgi:hypothetical protein
MSERPAGSKYQTGIGIPAEWPEFVFEKSSGLKGIIQEYGKECMREGYGMNR